jgi:hypothetical protein
MVVVKDATVPHPHMSLKKYDAFALRLADAEHFLT